MPLEAFFAVHIVLSDWLNVLFQESTERAVVVVQLIMPERGHCMVSKTGCKLRTNCFATYEAVTSRRHHIWFYVVVVLSFELIMS